MIDTTEEKNRITTKAQLTKAVKKLGTIQRKITETQAEMDAEAAKVIQRFKRKLERYKQQAEDLDEQATTFCREHRDRLLEGQETKTLQLTTGTIQFKQGRPRVVLNMDQDLVVARLQEAGYDEAVNIKATVDKRVVLANPEIVTKVAGLAIEEGAESISIKPLSV